MRKENFTANFSWTKAKLLNPILTNQVQQCTEMITYHNSAGFIKKILMTSDFGCEKPVSIRQTEPSHQEQVKKIFK